MKLQADTRELSIARARILDFAELTKARINLFVVVSALVGFLLGSLGSVDVLTLAHTLLATYVVSGGAAALNQFLERHHDSRMIRTAGRPLPSGRIVPERALLCGTLMLAGGLVYLAGWVNWQTAGVGALTAGIYLFLYTPLKRRTPLNTAVGAVAGALPPVGGWTAARGEVGAEALVLFAIVFIWQFPHFFSIAWLYREDYARGGYRMVSMGDPSGSRTARQIVLYSLVLLPFSLVPAVLGVSGTTYFFTAVGLSAALIAFSVRFARSRTDRGARGLMRASLAYLPLLWLVMIIDRMP